MHLKHSWHMPVNKHLHSILTSLCKGIRESKIIQSHDEPSNENSMKLTRSSSFSTYISSSHRFGINNILTLFPYPFKMQVWCYLPFIIPFAIIMALRPQVYYLQIIIRTGENYLVFHFDITFVIAEEINSSMSSGNVYSYTTLTNMLPMQHYFDFSEFWYMSFLQSSSLYNIPLWGYFPFRYQLMNTKPE